MDTISKIRSLQTDLNNPALDIPLGRREINNVNLRWLLRNITIKNPVRAVTIMPKIKILQKELIHCFDKPEARCANLIRKEGIK